MNSLHHTSVRSETPNPFILTWRSVVVNALKTERGLALQDLLTGAYEYAETIVLKPHARVYLLDFLATVE